MYWNKIHFIPIRNVSAMKTTTNYLVMCLSVLAGMSLLWVSCQKEEFRQTTDTTPNISTFLANEADYSVFSEAINLAGASSYLDAWGTYTVFAPDNAAMETYLQSEGVSGVSELSEAEVSDLVNRHIVPDTVSTEQFRDGKIDRSSVFGMYITTAVENIDGQSHFVLNKESRIILPDIRVGNGVVHGVDKVFTKVTQTVMEEIANDPTLSLFAQALRITGLDALLNGQEEGVYYTVLAVSNTAFEQAGIASVQDLVDKYSNTGDPANPQDSMYMHMSYHVLPDLKYVSDLAFSSSHATQVPRQVLLVKVNGEQILLNEEVWLGELEEGAELDRQASDNTAANGVLHYINDDIYIKQRSPFAVHWDPADQPELRVAGVYRRGELKGIPKGYFKDITWGGADNRTIDYYGVASGSFGGAAYGDYLEVYLRNNSSTIPWVEFKTPVVVRGRYKVWVGWRTRTDDGGNTIDTYVNGEKLSRSINNADKRITTLPERELEALGFKKHLVDNNGNYNCKMVGIVDIEITDRQTIRFEATSNARARFNIDLVQFIPIDQEQLYPQFDTEGNAVYP